MNKIKLQKKYNEAIESANAEHKKITQEADKNLERKKVNALAVLEKAIMNLGKNK